MNKKNWTELELKYLRDNAGLISYDDMALSLRKSSTAIRCKIIELGLPRRKPNREVRKWSDEEIAYLKEKYPMTPVSDIADDLGICYQTVNNKAKELGLQRSKDFGPKVWRDKYVRNYKHNIRKVWQA